MRDLRQMIALCVSSLAVTACVGGAPTRIDVVSDTIEIYGPRAVALEARTLGSDGHATIWPRLKYSVTSSVAHVNKGAVNCVHTGDAVVRIASRSLARDVTVLCRPIKSFGFTGNGVQDDRTWSGGPSFPIPIPVAYDSNNKVVTIRHGTAQVRDDSIVRMSNGRVYPLRRGYTWIDMDFDGTRRAIRIGVVDKIAAEPLRLVGGEIKTWRGEPGAWYEIRLDEPRASGARGGLVLAAFYANCSKAHEGEQHYYCITKENGSIIVMNPSKAGSGVEREGELSIYRKARVQ